MHLIKKYANRKLYDTKDKRYLTMDRLAELIKSGEEVSIVDNETGDDLTSSIVSQLLAREDSDTDKAVPSRVLMQMLRKGRGTLFGYGKKYVSLWQSAFTMSKDEIEKLVNSQLPVIKLKVDRSPENRTWNDALKNIYYLQSRLAGGCE